MRGRKPRVANRLDNFRQKTLKQNGQKVCGIVAGIRSQHITVASGNNLIWYDKVSADTCAPVCKSYNF